MIRVATRIHTVFILAEESDETMKSIVFFLLHALQKQILGLGAPNATLSGSPTSNPWNQSYYHTFDPEKLGGAPNVTAALGNPLKGIFGGVRWTTPPLPENVPFSLEWYNLAVSMLSFV